MTFDSYQTAAIECERNVVVTAGAGSGKTTVLSERFARLIREGKAEVDEILTLTFTRKAAAEMYDRIYRQLLSDVSRPAVADAVARFETAQISTLDSFCAQIVRNDAGRFGITADFSVSEEDALQTISETALSFLLANQDHPGVRALVAENGMSRTIEDGLVPLGLEYFTLAETKDLEEMRRLQNGALDRGLSDRIETIRAAAAAILDLPASTKTISTAHMHASAVDEYDDLREAGRYGDLAELIDGLAHTSKPKSNAKREELLALAAIIEDVKPVAAEAGEICHTMGVAEQIKEVLDALALYQHEIQAVKRATGNLTFQDVVDMSVVALSENLELREFYKRRFRYIMIDEFQDNNEQQKKLLYLLSESYDHSEPGIPGSDAIEKDKLYFVGDEKQSIYRFRGADVRVFKSLAEELQGNGGESVQLLNNYRSTPDLVTFFNYLFERLMGVAAPDKPEHEADFAPLSAGQEDVKTPSTIAILYKPYAEDVPAGVLSSGEAEAYAVSEYIAKAVQSGSVIVRDDGESRPARYDDFAILLRSGTAQATFERMLRHFGVPYNAGSVRSLFLEAPVNDVYNLLQLVVYPSDRLAYASLLRSPLVGLSDESIVRLLRETADPFAAEADALLGPTDQQKIAQGRELYEEVLGLADVVSPAELVSRVWYDYGYRYLLLSEPRYHPYIEHYNYFHALAARFDGKPLVSLVDYIRPLLGSYERIPDLEILGRDETGVQILTIHKSKGLEFPVVIVANTGNAGRPDDGGSQPYYLSDKYGLTLNLSPVGSRGRRNFFYRLGKEENQVRELAELKRLLYVAATRAESHLLFSGYHHHGNRNREDVLLNMLLKTLDVDVASEDPQATGGATVHVIPDRPTSVLAGDSAFADRQSLESARVHYDAAAVRRRVSQRTEFTVTEINRVYAETDIGKGGHESATSTPGGETIGDPENPSEELASDALIEELGISAFFGTLTHALIAANIANRPDSVREDSVRWPSVVPDRDRAAILADAAALAKGIVATDWWRSIGATSEQIESEVELLFASKIDDEQCFFRGTVDVLAKSRKGWTIVDFKTDRLLNTAHYELQMALYAEAVMGLEESTTESRVASAYPRLFLVHLRSTTPMELSVFPEPGRSALDAAATAVRRIRQQDNT